MEYEKLHVQYFTRRWLINNYTSSWLNIWTIPLQIWNRRTKRTHNFPAIRIKIWGDLGVQSRNWSWLSSDLPSQLFGNQINGFNTFVSIYSTNSNQQGTLGQYATEVSNLCVCVAFSVLCDTVVLCQLYHSRFVFIIINHHGDSVLDDLCNSRNHMNMFGPEGESMVTQWSLISLK